MRLTALALAAALTLTGPGGCSRPGERRPEKTFIVAGSVRLTGQSGLRAGEACTGTGAQADLHAGTTVVVETVEGRRLGLSQLLDGVGTEVDEALACVWPFFVSDVDAALDAYQVRVGDRAPRRYDVSGIHGAVDITIPAR
jgi:hypothetical protein